MPEDNGAAPWRWEEAEARVAAHIAALAMPAELGISAAEARDVPAVTLTERLAHLSYWISLLNREMAVVEARLSLSKGTLDHAVGRSLAAQDDKGPLGPRAAAIIAASAQLRGIKRSVMEDEALERALRRHLEALDTGWRTVSRVLSARLKEPLE